MARRDGRTFDEVGRARPPGPRASQRPWPALRDAPVEFAGRLRQEIERALGFVASVPPAVTFFGSARVVPDTPAFEMGRRWGAALLAAHHSVDRRGEDPVGRRTEYQLARLQPRTGAGPGLMEAVAHGYVAARARRGAGAARRTQGSAIELPAEQATNPYTEDVAQFSHFLPRRLALTERARGFVGLPGGFGTLNEVLEAVRLGAAVVLHGERFWRPIVDTLNAAWLRHDLRPALASVPIVDHVDDGLDRLARLVSSAAPGGHHVDREHTINDIVATLPRLATAEPNLAVLGGQNLLPSDRELDVGLELAARWARSGGIIKTCGYGAFPHALRALQLGAHAHWDVRLVRGPTPDASALSLRWSDSTRVRARSVTVHKLFVYENTRAIVALPGGLDTLDEVLEVACLMQTRKIDRRPLVLVGASFWRPILDVLSGVLLGGRPPLIDSAGMGLLQVASDLDDAWARLAAARRSHGHASNRGAGDTPAAA